MMRANLLLIAIIAFLGHSSPLRANDAWIAATEALNQYDDTRASSALRAAAEAGHRRAQETLAFALWYGEALYAGIPANRREAMEWFGRAASGGSDVAMHLLRRWARHGNPDAAKTLASIRP